MENLGNSQRFMILPPHLNHLREEYKKLWAAVEVFDSATFEKLVNYLPLAVARDSANNSILHITAKVGNPQALAYVLNRPQNRPPFEAVNFAHCTALQEALISIATNRPDHKLREVVRLLLEAGDDPRLPHLGSNSALLTTSVVKCPLTVLRIYHSVVLRVPNKLTLMKMLRNAEWTMKHFIWTKDLQLLKLFIDHDSTVLTGNGNPKATPLHQAVDARASVDVFNLFLSYNLDPNITTAQMQNTPLHRICDLAGEWNNLDIVNTLLSAGADPNLLNRTRRNCLHFAAKSGSDRVVRALLKHDVSYEDWDSTGKNAMHYAAISGSVQVISTLLEIGLSVIETVRDAEGATSLHLASQYCRTEAAVFIMSQGLHPNWTNYSNMTAAHYAVKKQASNLDRRCTEMIDLLVDYGAKLFEEEDGHASVLRYCIANKLFHNASIVMRHLALNVDIDPKAIDFHMKMIEDDEILKEVYNSCVAELERAKKFVVYGWVTLHKILTGTEKVLKPLMWNSNFVIDMNSLIINRTIYNMFPIYASRIINKFATVEKEQRRINKASQSLSHLIGFSNPKCEIISKIIQHLDPADIDRLEHHQRQLTAESILSVRKDLAPFQNLSSRN